MTKTSPTREGGFTLIELIIVLIIIAAVAVFGFRACDIAPTGSDVDVEVIQ